MCGLRGAGSFAGMAPRVRRKPACPCVWGVACANAYQSQPCYWVPHAPFLQINLLFGPHPVTVSAAHWQAPAASVLRAWGRRLAGTAGPSPHGYRKVAGNSLAAAQILQARQSAWMLFHHLFRPEGVSLVWPHAADAGAPEGRRGGTGVFSCRQKAKAHPDNPILLCWVKTVIPSHNG